MSRLGPMNPGVEMAVRLRLACEAHEPGLVAHLDHVAHYACELGRMLALPAARILALHNAVPLHDLGKIGLPWDLVNKPTQLTAAEMDTMKTHTTIGHRILDGSRWSVMRCAATVALSHHENWDGSGYPHGLRGRDIPLEARIVAVADVYDALLSRRSYKPAWGREQVIEELRRLRGIKFDPALLDVFLANLDSLHSHAA